MIRIGKIVASHGLNGAVIMTHLGQDGKWLKKGDTLMLEMQKASVSFRAITEVRNRFVNAYQEIMNMPI